MSWVQLVFEDSLERAKEKEEKEAKKRRRLADDFTDLLRNTKVLSMTYIIWQVNSVAELHSGSEHVDFTFNEQSSLFGVHYIWPWSIINHYSYHTGCDLNIKMGRCKATHRGCSRFQVLAHSWLFLHSSYFLETRWLNMMLDCIWWVTELFPMIVCARKCLTTILHTYCIKQRIRRESEKRRTRWVSIWRFLCSPLYTSILVFHALWKIEILAWLFPVEYAMDCHFLLNLNEGPRIPQHSMPF